MCVSSTQTLIPIQAPIATVCCSMVMSTFFFLVRKTFGLAFGITRMETAFHLTKRKVLELEDRGLGTVSRWVSFSFLVRQNACTCNSITS